MQQPKTIHPGQWEIINETARPKNKNQQPIESDFYKRHSEGLNWGDYLKTKVNDFEQFATQYTYPCPNVKDAIVDAEGLVFVPQYRIHELKWQNEDPEYLESFGSVEDYLLEHKAAQYTTGIETRIVIAPAEAGADVVRAERYVLKGEAQEAIWDNETNRAIGIMFDGLAIEVLNYLNSKNEKH